MEHHEQQREWVIKRHLSAEVLREYVARLATAVEETGAVVTIPAAPLVAAPTAPSTEPGPS